MNRVTILGISSAALMAAVGVAAAAWLGAPFAAALLAALAGALAAALALSRSAATLPAARPAGEPPAHEDPADRFLVQLIEAMDEPMLVVRDRRVRRANRAAFDLLGRHIEGTDIRLALRHPVAAGLLAAEGDGPAAETVRTELVGLGGADRHWGLTISPLAEGDRLVRLVDLSQARAAEQMRADFVANASHELRTPLATLLGFLETLQDEAAAGDPKTRERFLKIMFDEATRMRGLVDDLISLSRIEAERFAAPSEPVDLEKVIGGVRDSVTALAEARGSEILVDHQAEATIVQGDAAQLGQLLRNLVVNALHYGRSGAPVRVVLGEGGGGMIRVSVIDQGEGIPAEHIPRLTERFYRIDAGRSRQVGGTGLGLAIAKHIALRHRGRLEIESRLGTGTEVHLFLPHAPR